MFRAVISVCVSALVLSGGVSPAYGIEGSAVEVLQIISKQASVSKKPVFVLDLDETVIDSTVRRYLSYRDAIDEVCRKHPQYKMDCLKAASITPNDFGCLTNRYDDRYLFTSLKGVTEEAYALFRQVAFPIYLSNRWIADSDSFIPGAARFLRELEKLNGTLFFVSARSIEDQSAGTIESLKRLGLITAGEEWRVFLKPNGEASLAFKRRVFTELKLWTQKLGGDVVGVFENEPENMNAMVELFPGAVPVFVKGAYFKPEPVRPEAIQIKDFWLN